jgi:hypothetical protein
MKPSENIEKQILDQRQETSEEKKKDQFIYSQHAELGWLLNVERLNSE